MKNLRGTIVEESLKDNRFLNHLQIVSVRVTAAKKPQDRWHVYHVTMNLEQVYALAEQLLPRWYAHFWNDTSIYVVFAGYEFEISRHDTSTWQPAIDFGLRQGIPAKQLDFLIEE